MAVKISELGNLAAWSDTTYIPAVSTASMPFTTVKSTASSLKTYVLGTVTADIANLYANTVSVAGSLSTLSAQIVAANVGLKGYVDQSNSIQTVYTNGQITAANAGVTAANVGMKGYVDFGNTIQNAYINGQITAANTGVTAANVGMKGYVDFGNTNMRAYVDGQILAANAGVSGLSQSKISSGTNNVTVNGTYVNIAISSSNVAAFGATALIITGSLLPSVNNTSNLGAPTLTFNTVFAKATTAQYADLAEKYLADNYYDPGTVLEFGGAQEVTEATVESTRVAGVVSSNPAYLMNNGLNDEYSVALALQGRVKCKVTGNINKGDMLVSAGSGIAKSSSAPVMGSVIGKALENFEGQTGTIEVVVGRL